MMMSESEPLIAVDQHNSTNSRTDDQENQTSSHTNRLKQIQLNALRRSFGANRRSQLVAVFTMLLAVILVILMARHFRSKSERTQNDHDQAKLDRVRRTIDQQNFTIYRQLNTSIDHRHAACDDFFNHTCGNYRQLLLSYGVESFWMIPIEFSRQLMHRGLTNRRALRYTKSKAVRYLFDLMDDCRSVHQGERCDAWFKEHHRYFNAQFSRIYLDQLILEQGKDKILQTRHKVVKMAIEIRKAIEQILQHSDWLDESTRILVLERLTSMRQVIGFEEWILDDTELDKKLAMAMAPKVVPGNLEENERLWKQHYKSYVSSRLGLEWSESAESVASEYDSWTNAISIFHAFFQKPFFEYEDPPSIHFGFVGFIIAHEIFHAFDGQKRKRKGWSEEAKRRLDERSQCLVRQYGAIVEPLSQLKLNGTRLLPENICDNGAIKAAYRAWQMYQKTDQSRSMMQPIEYELYTPQQLFFYSYAMNWCEVFNRRTLEVHVQYDHHAPFKYRVNAVLQNSVDFAKAFGCPANSSMNPQKKCAVW